MVLSFKEEHVSPIIKGIKTQTRRQWKRRNAKHESLHWATTNRYKIESRFARLKILNVWQERLGDISEEDAYKEGGYTVEEYKKVWIDINGSWDPDEIVYVVEFEVYWICGGRNAPNTPKMLKNIKDEYKEYGDLLLSEHKRTGEEIEKEDMKFEMMHHFRMHEKDPSNCKMCGYCTGEYGFFTHACLDKEA